MSAVGRSALHFTGNAEEARHSKISVWCQYRKRSDFADALLPQSMVLKLQVRRLFPVYAHVERWRRFWPMNIGRMFPIPEIALLVDMGNRESQCGFTGLDGHR